MRTMRRELAEQIMRLAYGIPSRDEVWAMAWDFLRDRFRKRWHRDGQGRWV